MGTVAHYLPEWAQWFQTFGTPVVTATAVVFFGYWQLRIAREKVRQDLYDRRYKVFYAYHQLVATLNPSNELSWKEAAINCMYMHPQSIFLFDKAMHTYLGNLHQECFDIYAKYHHKHKEKEDFALRMALGNELRELSPRIAIEMVEKFRPFLEIDDLSDSWLFRRPHRPPLL